MSFEQSILIKTPNTKSIDTNKKNIAENIETSVDINYLLVKLREKEKSQRQENLLLFGVFGSIVITIGIIVTL